MKQSSKDRSASCSHNEFMYIEVDVYEEDVVRIEALAQTLTINDETSDRLRAEIESILGHEPVSSAKEPC